MADTLLEKLNFKDEKNILIMGLPASVEKSFKKLKVSKSVTPLLKKKLIDFALIFVLNEKQLNDILKDVIPALHDESKFWIGYPKATSKIRTDLTRQKEWEILKKHDFEGVRQVAVDHVWSTIRFKKAENIPARKKTEVQKAAENNGIDNENRTVELPEDFLTELKKNKKGMEFFDSLSFTNKKEYVVWVNSAKRADTRNRRILASLEKIMAGKPNPSAK